MNYIRSLVFLVIAFCSLSAKALVIDTTSTWDGVTFNSGYLASAQSFAVDTTDTFFDDITFSFAGASNGRTFGFSLADAFTGGTTFFTSSFTVSGGQGFIDIDTNLVGGSTVWAIIDYNGFTGETVGFQNDAYAGGYWAADLSGTWFEFNSLDSVFVANFTGNNVPEPSVIALFALGLIGVGVARRRTA